MVGARELHHPPQEPCGAADRHFRGRRSSCGRRVARPDHLGTVGSMHVVLADPPASLHRTTTSSRRRSRGPVRPGPSPFRFGTRPAPDGYRLQETFYPRSSGIDRRRRLAVRAPSIRRRCADLVGTDADVLHFQWLAAPELDRAPSERRHRSCSPHDLLPRRTARRTRTWRSLFARFDRVVVHSERGRATLAEFGVAPERLRDPAPRVSKRSASADDGRTVLSLGVIRPYKGLSDAVDAVLALRRPASSSRVTAHPSRRPARAGRRARRMAARVSRSCGARAGALGGDGRRLPLPRGARPVGALLQALGAGRPGGRLRRRRARRGRRALRGRPESSRRTTSRRSPGLFGAARGCGRARRGAGRRRARPRRAHLDAAAQAHLALYRELV